MDRLTPEQRKRCMSAVRGKNTRPEMLVRRYLWAHGVRYRVNDCRLPGRPDIVLSRCGIAIFVHGCFWHAHEGCRLFRVPRSHADFWRAKFARNKARDAAVRQRLRQMGWRTMVVWECQLRPPHREEILREILHFIDATFLARYGAPPVRPAAAPIATPSVPYSVSAPDGTQYERAAEDSPQYGGSDEA